MDSSFYISFSKLLKKISWEIGEVDCNDTAEIPSAEKKTKEEINTLIRKIDDDVTEIAIMREKIIDDLNSTYEEFGLDRLKRRADQFLSPILSFILEFENYQRLVPQEFIDNEVRMQSETLGYYMLISSGRVKYTPNISQTAKLFLSNLESLKRSIIALVNKYSGINGVHTTTETKAAFKVKKGSKADLIRILNAMWELKLITNPDGTIPLKKDFMKEAGIFFGESLENYEVNLSTAFQGTLESNTQIFSEMANVITSKYTESLKKKR